MLVERLKVTVLGNPSVADANRMETSGTGHIPLSPCVGRYQEFHKNVDFVDDGCSEASEVSSATL
jgi:hypothetical protein